MPRGFLGLCGITLVSTSKALDLIPSPVNSEARFLLISFGSLGNFLAQNSDNEVRKNMMLGYMRIQTLVLLKLVCRF